MDVHCVTSDREQPTDKVCAILWFCVTTSFPSKNCRSLWLVASFIVHGSFCYNLKWNKMRHANTDRLCCCFFWRYDDRCSILNRCKCKKKNWSNKQWRDRVTSNGNKSVCLCHIDWSHRFSLSHMWTQWIHRHKIVNQKRKKGSPLPLQSHAGGGGQREMRTRNRDKNKRREETAKNQRRTENLIDIGSRHTAVWCRLHSLCVLCVCALCTCMWIAYKRGRGFIIAYR